MLNCICVILQFGNVDTQSIPKWFRCVSYLLQCECCNCNLSLWRGRSIKLKPIAVNPTKLKLQMVATDPPPGNTPSTPNPDTYVNGDEDDEEDVIIDLELQNRSRGNTTDVGIPNSRTNIVHIGMTVNLPTPKEGSTEIVLTPNTSPIIGSTQLRAKSSVTNISTSTVVSAMLIEPNKDMDSSSGYSTHHSPYSPYSPYSPHSAVNDNDGSGGYPCPTVISDDNVLGIAIESEPKLAKVQTHSADIYTIEDDTELESQENQ